jgi:hypothetical protein
VGRCLRVTGAATCDWGALDLADTDAVTGVLPIGNQAEQTMAGDVSGSTGANTVDAIRETTIGSAGGALATGAVLRVTGPASCDWGAVDLADGDAVTGLLPTGNVDASSTPTASKIVKTGASNEVGLLYWHADGLSIGQAPSLGGGVGVLGVKNAKTEPTTAPTGGPVVYPFASAYKVYSVKQVRTTLAPETNSAATETTLPRLFHTTHTTNDTITAALITITLPTASSFDMMVTVTGQVTGTDTRAHYRRLIRGGRGGAGNAVVDDAATIGVDFDAIGVAAVPTIASDGAQAITIKVTGKAATEIDWRVRVDDAVIYSV